MEDNVFFAIDIRIGNTHKSVLTSVDRFNLYSEILKHTLDSSVDWKRLGPGSPITFSHRQHHREQSEFFRKIIEEFNTSIENSNKVTVLIIDILSNTSLFREPVMVDIYRALDKLATKNNSISYFVLLCPELPSNKSTSSQYLYNSVVKKHNISVFLVSLAGEIIFCHPSPSDEIFSKMSEAPSVLSIIQDLIGTIEERAMRACIKRLGHFKTSKKSGCRHFTYQFITGEEELIKIFSDRVHQLDFIPEVIVFESKKSEIFRHVVRTYAETHRLHCLRFDDVLRDNATQKQIESNKILFAVDAVQSGKTVQTYLDRMDEFLISRPTKVIAGITRNVSITNSFGDTTIHGLVQMEPETTTDQCPQCVLGLPHTPEEYEEALPIRAYDLLYMSNDAGWEEEPEDQRPPSEKWYPYIPSFNKILEKYGDWLAYRSYRYITTTLNLRTEFTIVRPEQADVAQLSEKLRQISQGDISEISVPQKVIEQIKKTENYNWSPIIDNARRAQINNKIDSEYLWFFDLECLLKSRDQAVIIIDIFSASDTTANCMKALLKQMGATTSAYFCLINFAPHSSAFDTNTNSSLYDWYHPRKEFGVS